MKIRYNFMSASFAMVRIQGVSAAMLVKRTSSGADGSWDLRPSSVAGTMQE